MTSMMAEATEVAITDKGLEAVIIGVVVTTVAVMVGIDAKGASVPPR